MAKLRASVVQPGLSRNPGIFYHSCNPTLAGYISCLACLCNSACDRAHTVDPDYLIFLPVNVIMQMIILPRHATRAAKTKMLQHQLT